jgi:hypothetical protein
MRGDKDNGDADDQLTLREAGGLDRRGLRSRDAGEGRTSGGHRPMIPLAPGRNGGRGDVHK